MKQADVYALRDIMRDLYRRIDALPCDLPVSVLEEIDAIASVLLVTSRLLGRYADAMLRDDLRASVERMK